MADLLLIKPSKHLHEQIKKLVKQNGSILKNQSLSSEDYEFLNSLEDEPKIPETFDDLHTFNSVNDNYMKIDDLKLLCASDDVSLHDFVRGSTICVPENKVPERNPELEKRCQQLQREQENRMYRDMTKNVDSVRRTHPEDSIGYQSNFIILN